MTEITLLMTETQINSIVCSTREDLPNESCSLLLGKMVGDEYNVKVLKKMSNIANSQYSFNIDPDELMKVYQSASKEGLDIIGIYHSHLVGSRPSSTDLSYMRINPVIWLIYELSNSRFKAYMLIDDNLKEVKIKVSTV
ncbi:MAG: M67 family metallopeptidase [Thaumarchaeota archaeon]|nr:MAG: M67 family metallopeptidase [Nitrososphaerota archaeon]TLX87247.1 MAG: M67 family metallopeptidase [Nitrososphaerota archaeon]TLX91617.1 MAG: M67 family metallopeptidase [Nitrososphaerota archaeon]